MDPSPTARLPGRLALFGLPLDPVTLDAALALLSHHVTAARGGDRQTHTVVTLNPEFVMQARDDVAFRRAIAAADLVTADGTGIVYAARQLLGVTVPRAPGYDLSVGLMQQHGAGLRVFFLGAKPGVAEAAAQAAHERYGVTVAGVHHGYFPPAEDARVAALVGESQADLLLTAMGAARQEIFNDYWRGVLNVPVAMGVGGVLDVLAGTARLAPTWTRKLGVEFVWRVASDRSRWGRAPRLAQFVALVQREKRAKG